MKVNNPVDTTSTGDSRYLSSREVKKREKGIKVRMYGDAFMGFYYFQKDGDKVKVVRTKDEVEMENPTEGFQGADQKISRALYIVAWDYETEAPVLLSVDKVALINPILDVNNNEDLAGVGEYDFRMTFDANAAPADMYKVTRLDKTTLTAPQKKELEAFSKTCDLEAYMNGAEAFEAKEAEAKSKDDF